MFECVFQFVVVEIGQNSKIDVIDLKNESVVVGTDIKRRNKATEKGEEQAREGGRKEEYCG